MKLIELRRKRAALIEKARHLVDEVDKRDGIMTEQERNDYDATMAEIETLAGDIRRLEQLEALGPQQPAEGQQNGAQGATQQRRPMPDPQIGMERRDLRQYSLLRAIRAAYAARRGESNAWAQAPLEREASDAVARRLGLDPQGFFVPFDVMIDEQRDLNVGTPTAGGNLVATDLLASSFIELLRNRTVLIQAGATLLTGLVGFVDIPRQSGGATAYWVGEGGAPTESQQTVDQVQLAPHTVGAYTDWTRRLILQSSIDVERFVRDDLTAVVGRAIDLAGLHGDSGEDPNQPDGVENISGVGTPGGSHDWEGVVGLETEVSVANADVGRLGYITNALVRGLLKTTSKDTGSGMFVWTDTATPLNGYRALVTNQVRSDGGVGSDESFNFFGNWADLLIAMWSGLDILVDPYTHSTSGTMRIVALQDVDIAVRHAESFAYNVAATN